MKLQYLAVIFVIIIIPITLVMSSYLQTQIDTITLQTAYESNLNDATYGALKAFQINSVNNKYSSLSNSKIRDIEASINTFYTLIGTSMDQYVSSREELSVFIPAILFNLYDGYYIYSSYDNVYATDEKNKVVIQDDGKNYQDGLKPYIYYSCKYKLNNGNIIIINYTLDNAITVYGDVGDGKGYQTKSGYLIDPDKVQNINETTKTLKYDGVEIGPEELWEHLITIKDDGTIEEGDYRYIVYNNKKVYADSDGGEKYFWYDNYKKTYLASEQVKLKTYINNNGVGFRSISAYEYFKEAQDFSTWINENIGGLTEENAIGENGEKLQGKLSNSTGTEKIFKTKSNDANDPMLSGSTFNSHRMAIIRKSIETNLTAAIANYNVHSGSNYEFTMPVINEEDWYKIENNVSIASFMQGLPIGQKYFNNYSVITNTRNEEVINEQSIYLTANDARNNHDVIEYHQPGCKTLIEAAKANSDLIITAYTDLSFLRQTVKVSETNIHYFYPQDRTNQTTTGCYNCIVNASADYDIDSIIKGEIKENITSTSDQKVLYDADDLKKVRKAYITGLARERYDLYKSNFK